MIDECKQKENVSDEQVEEMMKQDNLESRPAKCMANCMLSAVNVVS